MENDGLSNDTPGLQRVSEGIKGCRQVLGVVREHSLGMIGNHEGRGYLREEYQGVSEKSF